jgi:hypothetical protein
MVIRKNAAWKACIPISEVTTRTHAFMVTRNITAPIMKPMPLAVLGGLFINLENI